MHSATCHKTTTINHRYCTLCSPTPGAVFGHKGFNTRGINSRIVHKPISLDIIVNNTPFISFNSDIAMIIIVI